MAAFTFIPNMGRLPVLEALPERLQLPVAKLGQNKSIEVVVADSSADGLSHIQVVFKYHKAPEHSQVLKSFRGLVPKRVEFNREHHFMMLSFFVS